MNSPPLASSYRSSSDGKTVMNSGAIPLARSRAQWSKGVVSRTLIFGRSIKPLLDLPQLRVHCEQRVAAGDRRPTRKLIAGQLPSHLPRIPNISEPTPEVPHVRNKPPVQGRKQRKGVT